MHNDGDVAYADYTFEQLMQARESINANKYPINFRNLISEISSRPEASQDGQFALRANEPTLPTEPISTPVTREQLTGHLVASALFLALGTYGLYTGNWVVRGEHLHGQEAVLFYSLIAIATCTNAMRLLSWIKNGGENGPMFRFGTQFSFAAIFLYICYEIFSLFRGGA